MKRYMLAATTVVALLFLLTLSASRASAAQLQFQLTSDHCGGFNTDDTGCLAAGGSAGTVTITDTGVANQVSIQVSLNAGYEIHNGGQDVDFGFNLNPNQTITYAPLPSNFVLPGGGLTQAAGTLHVDGVGTVEYGVQCTACSGTTGPSSLSLTITGTSLSTSSFVTNADLQYFAVDVAGRGTTGFVDASVPTSVPDGGMTIMLMGGALLGLETLRRRFRV